MELFVTFRVHQNTNKMLQKKCCSAVRKGLCLCVRCWERESRGQWWGPVKVPLCPLFGVVFAGQNACGFSGASIAGRAKIHKNLRHIGPRAPSARRPPVRAQHVTKRHPATKELCRQSLPDAAKEYPPRGIK